MNGKPRIAIVGAGPGRLTAIYEAGRISARQFGMKYRRKEDG